MSYGTDMILIRKENKARHLMAIDEICHYMKTEGKERAFKYYMAFFNNDLSWNEQIKIEKAIATENMALLENTCNDIIKKNRNIIIEIRNRFNQL